MTINNPTPEERQKSFDEQVGARGVFVPLRTCPLKNGIDIRPGGGENYCHRGCAWARDWSNFHCLIFGLQPK